MNSAWRLNVPASRKIVLLAMCDWANDDGSSCHPSIKAVAMRASMSPRQVQRVLHELIEQGWISVVGNAAGGAPGATRQYKINVALIRTGDTSDTGVNLSRVTNKAKQGETGDICDTRRVTSEAETGDTHVTQTTIDPPVKSNHVSFAGAAEQVGGGSPAPKQEVAPHVAACMAMIRAGISAAFVQQTNPDLIALTDAGHEPPEFEIAAQHALAVKGQRAAFAYALGIVRNGGGKARGSPATTGKPKPSATDNFKETTYVGTAIENFPPELRRHLERQHAE